MRSPPRLSPSMPRSAAARRVVRSKRRGRTVVAVLAAYWAVWTLYAVVAKASQDFHSTWARWCLVARSHIRNPKHPLCRRGWSALGFRFSPLATWAYDLFAVGIATLSLGSHSWCRRGISTG